MIEFDTFSKMVPKGSTRAVLGPLKPMNFSFVTLLMIFRLVWPLTPNLEDVVVKLTKFSQFDQICQTLPWRPRGWGRCKWSNSSKIIKRVTKLKCIGFKVPKTALFEPFGTIFEKVLNFVIPNFYEKKMSNFMGSPSTLWERGVVKWTQNHKFGP